MDNKTIIFLIALGSFIFGFLLILFQLRVKRLNWITSWIAAKILQGTGSLLLCFYGNSTEYLINITTNSFLLLGCAYEGWAIFYITGRPVSRRIRIFVALCIVAACIANFFKQNSNGIVEIFFLNAICYILAGWALLSHNSEKSILRIISGVSFILLALIFIVRALYGVPIFEQSSMVYLTFTSIEQNSLTAVFCNILISGFCLLLIAKEISDHELHVVQETLRKSEVHYQRMIETAIEGILSLDIQRRVTFVNRQMASMLGYTIDEMQGRLYESFITDDQLAEAETQKQIRMQGQDAVYELCFLRKDGARHWMLVSAKAIIDSAGKFIGSFGMFTDINERKLMEVALRESETKYRRFIETAIEGVFSLDNNRRITFVNKQMASMLGYTTEEMLGRDYASFLAEDQLIEDEIQKKLRIQGKDSVYERCFITKKGQRHWILVSAKAIMDDKDQFNGSFAMFTDINDRKIIEKDLRKLNEKLELLSNTDGLTGISNRRYFEERLKNEYNRLCRTNKEISLIMLDIDHFKNYNDFYGHIDGDECIKNIANVIKNALFRPADFCARYGGEEFVCILPETNKSGAIVIAERIRHGVEKFNIEHKKSNTSNCVTVSLGIVTSNCYSDEKPIDLLKKADIALYKSKTNGRNQVSHYSIDIQK